MAASGGPLVLALAGGRTGGVRGGFAAWVVVIRVESVDFGTFFKKKRLEQDLSLREFCRRHGYDWGNLSKLERGKLSPPQSHDILEPYARALGITEGSDDWYTVFDLAATVNGRIPDRIMNDEQLVAKLPALFRTVEGRNLSEQDIRKLVDLIRES